MLLRPFVAMMPILQAREALRESTTLAYGTGNVRKATADRIHSQWERAASAAQGWGGGAGRRIDLSRMNVQQQRAVIESMGIEYVAPEPKT